MPYQEPYHKKLALDEIHRRIFRKKKVRRMGQ